MLSGFSTFDVHHSSLFTLSVHQHVVTVIFAYHVTSVNRE